MQEPELIYIPPEHLDTVWNEVRPHIEKATKLSQGRYEPEDIADEIKRNIQLLWVIWDSEAKKTLAAMTTQIVDYPRRKVLRIPFIGGVQMHRWGRSFVQAMEKYAAKCGATGIEGAGRRGWARYWPGAFDEGAMLFKDIS